MIRISLSGKEDLNKKIQRLNDAAKRIPIVTNKAIQEFAFAVLKDAKNKHILKGGQTTSANIASRSGRLRSSINAQFSFKEENVDVTIGSDVVYAAIHEYGGVTGKGGRTVIKQRPYIKPALNEHYPILMSKLREIYKRYPNQ